MNQKSFQFRPTVQTLEERTVPAGNVVAQVFDGTLYVQGDLAGNQFSVVGGPEGSAAIRSLDGTTTVNGQVGPIQFNGIFKGLHIQGTGSSEIIGVEGFRADRTIVVYGGGGNDSIHLNGVVAGEGSIVSTNDGDDQVFVSASDFGSLFSLSTNGGNDFVSLLGNHFNKAALVNGGTGANTISSLNNAADKGLRTSFFVPGVAPTPAPVPTPADPAPTDPAPVDPATPVAPSVTISTTVGAATNVATIPFTATFSSPVTGFTAARIAATNGTVSNFTQVNATTYTFTVGATAQGVVSVSTAAGAGTSTDGLGSLASNIASVTFDITAPAVSVTTPTSDPTIASPIAFTIRFSEAVNGFTQSDIGVSNGTITSFTQNAANPLIFNVNVTPAGDGPVNLTVAAGVATDAAGNANTLGSAAANSLRTAAGLSTTIPNQNDPGFVALGAQGLRIRDVQVGTGSTVVGPNANVQVFFRGYLVSNGSVFDDSLVTGTPDSFRLSDLIVGFQQGVQGMRAGGIRQIFIPGDVALGLGFSTARPGIPLGSDTLFDVKIVSVS